jgi:hypothetical protein
MPKPWRERLTYTAMSVFVVWHSLAMVIAPAPDNSVTVGSLRVLLDPYITLFYLDDKWDFFAPDVDRGKQFRYVIEDAAGARHSFVPLEELNWFHPIYRRVGYWYDALVDSPETYSDFIAALLCRKHAVLHPISITLIGVEEQNFSPEDHLNGKHPLDSDIATVSTLKVATCAEK